MQYWIGLCFAFYVGLLVGAWSIEPYLTRYGAIGIRWRKTLRKEKQVPR